MCTVSNKNSRLRRHGSRCQNRRVKNINIYFHSAIGNKEDVVRLIKRVKIRDSKTRCLIRKSNRVTRAHLHSERTTTSLAVVHYIMCPLGRKEIWMDG